MPLIKSILVTFLILISLVFVMAQSRDDFRAKYHEQAYEIRHGVWMTANFAMDGEVCELVVKEQNNCRAGAVFLGRDAGISEILDELVPKVKRGKFLSHSDFATGCCDGYTDEYENISAIFAKEAQSLSKSYSTLTIRWKQRKCAGE